MRPKRDEITDLLDRVLDKGLVVNTDLIIGVAGVPLVGVDLRLALAGIKTMLDYGIWSDWEKAQRAAAQEEAEDGNR